jgi:hypothetical protein
VEKPGDEKMPGSAPTQFKGKETLPTELKKGLSEKALNGILGSTVSSHSGTAASGLGEKTNRTFYVEEKIKVFDSIL